MLQENIISFLDENGYEIQSMIGKGAFSKVYLAKFLDKLVAIKVVQKDLYPSNEVEAQIHSELNHPNIIRLITTFEGLGHQFIVMEYAQEGSLFRYHEKLMMDEEASQIIKGVLKGLLYIHDLNIIHRDIKPDNILIQNGIAKISDFGLSHKSVGYSKSCANMCGTLIYMAPEQIERQRYSKQVDIYSCGMVMFMLLSGGVHPVHVSGQSREQFLRKLGQTSEWLIPGPNFNDFAKDFFSKVTCISPFERYTASQALRHPWITRNDHDPIPMTIMQSMRTFQIQLTIARIFQAVQVINYIKKLSKNDLTLEFVQKQNQLTPDQVENEDLIRKRIATSCRSIEQQKSPQQKLRSVGSLRQLNDRIDDSKTKQNTSFVRKFYKQSSLSPLKIKTQKLQLTPNQNEVIKGSFLVNKPYQSQSLIKNRINNLLSSTFSLGIGRQYDQNNLKKDQKLPTLRLINMNYSVVKSEDFPLNLDKQLVIQKELKKSESNQQLNTSIQLSPLKKHRINIRVE